MFKRRDFMRGGAMFAAAGMGKLAFGRSVDGSAKLRVGILSDIHIKVRGKKREDYIGIEMLEKALRHFRSRDVDAVLIAGDMADRGHADELLAIGDAWRRVFPGNMRPDGGKVEKVFVTGNHDVSMPFFNGRKNSTEAERAAYAIGYGNNREKFWREAFDEEYQPMYVKDIRGYKFVGIQYGEFGRKGAVAAFLKSHRGELSGQKPFFYTQHYHLKGTCSAPWVWGQDAGHSAVALRKFPNAVAFSGHSHTPLSDDRTLWRGEFTSVGTASLKYLIPFGGRENSRIFGTEDRADQQMPFLACKDGHHGQVMTVYDDRIVFERYDFKNDLPAGPDWIVPLPASSASFEKRAESSPVPRFAPQAKVEVSTIDGVDRQNRPTKQIAVTFPNVRGLDGGTRAFDYEVRVEARNVDRNMTWATKRVYSPHFYWAAEKDDETVTCLFAVSELPASNGKLDPKRGRSYRFVVSPANSFGVQGNPICSEIQY